MPSTCLNEAAFERFTRSGVRAGHIAMFELWDEDRETFTIATTGLPGYLCLVEITRFIYTDAIVTTPLLDGASPSQAIYLDRWCYPPGDAAFEAAWRWLKDGGSEPVGWHRHPRSGRRR